MSNNIDDLQPGDLQRAELPMRLTTSCCRCGHEIRFRPSIMMRAGVKDWGHLTCPSCDTFLAVQLGECEATTEVWADFVRREQS